MAVHRHNTCVNLNFHECILHLVINALVSAEPGHRVVCRMAGRIAMEPPLRKIARNLNSSLGTVHNIYKQFEQTGDVQRNKPIYLRALNGQQEFSIDLSLFLSEMCKAVHEMTGLEVSASTLYRIIPRHGHGLTCKKIQVAKQRSDVYRSWFMAEIQLHWEQFVWIDETGCAAKDHIRRFTQLLDLYTSSVDDTLQLPIPNVTTKNTTAISHIIIIIIGTHALAVLPGCFSYCISSIRRHSYCLFCCWFCPATIRGQLFEGGVYFFGKPGDIHQ